MQELMTFQQITEAGQVVYPEAVSEDLQGVIFDWFRFRQVCDNDKFPVFFSRVLSDNLDRYNELLRISPGVSKYDWLVENYSERQILGDESTSDNTTATNTRTTEGSTENLHTMTQNGETGRTVTSSDTARGTASGDTTQTNTGTLTKTGTETNTGTASETTHNETAGTNSTEREASEDYGTGLIVTNARTGLEQEDSRATRGARASTKTNKNNQTRTTARSTERTGISQTDNGTEDASKAGPMNAAVTNTSPVTAGTISAGMYSGGSAGALTDDFNGYASSMNKSITHGQGYNNENGTDTENVSYTGTADVETNSEDAANDRTDSVRRYGYAVNENGQTVETAPRTDTQTTTGAITRAESVDGSTGTEEDGTKTGNSSNVLSFTNRQDTTNGTATGSTENEYSEETTGSVTEAGTSQTTNRGTDTVTTEGTQTDNATKTGTATRSTNTRDRSTGRTRSLALLLEEAKHFIVTTEAWGYLRGKLEVCFLGVYDI